MEKETHWLFVLIFILTIWKADFLRLMGGFLFFPVLLCPCVSVCVITDVM